ncbi:hypothetical protein [Streptomyces sp. 8L]|uniref:hypothetical protein n=1 Tax=Streptomyces sp. 8L TaxID=2877242 RepID=UPI0021E533D0|nr:hypothetical protein [Streptomyces sp. 8L]
MAKVLGADCGLHVLIPAPVECSEATAITPIREVCSTRSPAHISRDHRARIWSLRFSSSQNIQRFEAMGPVSVAPG